jgi:hypothetical protein
MQAMKCRPVALRKEQRCREHANDRSGRHYTTEQRCREHANDRSGRHYTIVLASIATW